MDFDIALEIAEATLALNQSYSNYTAKVSQIASRLQKLVLNPWLDKMGYNFVSGNGDYVIYDPNIPASRYHMNDTYLMDDLPKLIETILRMEVEGSQGNSELGLWMLNHKQED